jgi:hypothetical protein
MVRILAYFARGRGFDSRTTQTFVCINISVYIGSERFICIVYIIRYLESITQAFQELTLV